MPLQRATPILPVRDIEQATDFYRERLRFGVVHQETDYAILSRDSVEVHLWLAGDESWKARGETLATRPIVTGAESFLAGTASCRIEVRDIDALYRECKEREVLYSAATVVESKPWGTREFPALDLERNLLTFFERTG